MNVIESQPQSLTEQAVDALKAFEPMVDQILSYADFTVAEDGIGRVEEAHKAVKRLRIELDKKRKELNEGALQYQRTVNATAKSLTERISKVESRLEAERETFEEVKRKEKAAKEAEKAAVLNERVARLSGAGIHVTDLRMIEGMDPTDFEFFFAKESRIAAEAKAEAERLEALRLEENARQAEELRIRQEELKAEQDRLAAERAAEAAKLRAEREAMESERAEMRRQQEEIAKHQAELRAKAEAEAAEKRRLEKEAEQARREAAAKPELEKLDGLVREMRKAGVQYLGSVGGVDWASSFDMEFSLFAERLTNSVRDSI